MGSKIRAAVSRRLDVVEGTLRFGPRPPQPGELAESSADYMVENGMADAPRNVEAVTARAARLQEKYAEVKTEIAVSSSQLDEQRRLRAALDGGRELVRLERVKAKARTEGASEEPYL